MTILKFRVGAVLQHIVDHLQKSPDARLVLVKDEGIYICPLPNPGPSTILYADGCNPAHEDEQMTVFEGCRGLLGGDDFVDDLPFEWLRMALDFRWCWMRVRVEKDQLVLVNGNGSQMPEIVGGRNDEK